MVYHKLWMVANPSVKGKVLEDLAAFGFKLASRLYSLGYLLDRVVLVNVLMDL